MGLYCEQESNRNFIQSIFTIGAFIGLILINMISDTKGRKISLGVSLLSINIGVLSNYLNLFFIAILIGGYFKIF
jgi:MFS family permease